MHVKQIKGPTAFAELRVDKQRFTCTTAVTERFVHTPLDQEPVEGSPLSVSCTSDGGTFIVWSRDGVNIPISSPYFTQSSSAFGSTGTLSIASAHHSLHTGRYECLAVFPDSSTATASSL